MVTGVEARIEARPSKLETRVSRIKLRDSTRLPTPDNDRYAGNGGQVRASLPLNVKLPHDTGFVAITLTPLK